MSSEITQLLQRAARGRLAGGLLGVLLVFSLVGYADATTRHGGQRTRPTFILRVLPLHETILAGSSAGFRIRLRREHFPGAIKLRLRSDVPAGVVASFSTRRTRRSRALLVVRTTTETLPGDYRLRIVAKSGKFRRLVVVTLTVGGVSEGSGTTVATLPAFTLTGQVTGPLEPGIPQPVDVAITNPNPVPLSVSALSVSVAGISAPQATGVLTCTAADFTSQPYAGPDPVVVPPSSTRTLHQLGLPADEWPQLELIDLPRDQDGCQGATLTLAYDGHASLG
jgi:hypothetical protein